MTLLGQAVFAGALGSVVVVVVNRLLRSPPSVPAIFQAGRPEHYQVGEIKTDFVQVYGVWVIRTSKGFYALKAECTHLQCTPLWEPQQNRFRCPCHLSHFKRSGQRLDGPAPRALERFKIGLSREGAIVVDRRRLFLYEKGEWEEPEAFLPYPASG